jgi:hypothetical protein
MGQFLQFPESRTEKIPTKNIYQLKLKCDKKIISEF